MPLVPITNALAKIIAIAAIRSLLFIKINVRFTLYKGSDLDHRLSNISSDILVLPKIVGLVVTRLVYDESPTQLEKCPVKIQL